jgi:hypothetical protein
MGVYEKPVMAIKSVDRKRAWGSYDDAGNSGARRQGWSVDASKKKVG